MERAFSPLFTVAIISWGFAPGWYEAVPLVLKLMRHHIFESAKGASHISLGRSPRNEAIKR
jgi:hypothetical protein